MTTKKVVTFIKQYFFMLALAATFVGFSAFKYVDSKIQSDVTLYFQGDPTDEDDVKDPSLWQEDPNHGACVGNQLACAMIVDPSDAVGDEDERELNPATITLEAQATDEGFIPEKDPSSTSPNPLQIENRNVIED